MIRQTSLDALKSIKHELGQRQREVLEQIAAGSMSDKQISAHLRRPINTVTPRRGELIKLGFVKSAGTEKCPQTNRRVHVWAITPAGRRALEVEG